MALRINTQIAGDVFILLCDGRIVFGDEDAILRDQHTGSGVCCQARRQLSLS